jgi:hypothetical protein
MDYQQHYLANQNKSAKNYDIERFRGKKDQKKELEFFKGLASQANNIAEDIMSQGYDTNKINKLEKLLADFQGLYNVYYQEKVRNPAYGLSNDMRAVMDAIRNVLLRIREVAPMYSQRVKEHLTELENMYVRTGGRKSGGSVSTYTGDVSNDIDLYEPSIMERINNQKNIERYENYKYSRLAMNDDFN